jgi:hypothetical protein
MDQQTCVDCHQLSPPTETNYTLISAKHGWRLHRERTPQGLMSFEWRCPKCWQRRKDGGPAPASPTVDTPASFFARARRHLARDSEPPSRS